MNTNTQQVWFITGAGKGLGAAIAKEALQNGYTVVAAARNPEAAKKELGENANLHCVRLDLMDEQSIQNAVTSKGIHLRLHRFFSSSFLLQFSVGALLRSCG